MKKIVFVVGLALAFGPNVASAQEKSSASQNLMGADVQVKAAIAKAKNLKPPASASKNTTVGKGNASVNTANTEGDDDSVWVNPSISTAMARSKKPTSSMTMRTTCSICMTTATSNAKAEAWARGVCSLP